MLAEPRIHLHSQKLSLRRAAAMASVLVFGRTGHPATNSDGPDCVVVGVVSFHTALSFNGQ